MVCSLSLAGGGVGPQAAVGAQGRSPPCPILLNSCTWIHVPAKYILHLCGRHRFNASCSVPIFYSTEGKNSNFQQYTNRHGEILLGNHDKIEQRLYRQLDMKIQINTLHTTQARGLS